MMMLTIVIILHAFLFIIIQWYCLDWNLWKNEVADFIFFFILGYLTLLISSVISTLSSLLAQIQF